MFKKNKSMEKNNPYVQLAMLVLPPEVSASFELVRVEVESVVDGTMLHIYLDEYNRPPSGKGKLRPNGFYPESIIRDFPIRDQKVSLHVRRRRWLDDHDTSVSTDWTLVERGTRYSKEFAAFLKGMLGQIPDYGPLS